MQRSKHARAQSAWDSSGEADLGVHFLVVVGERAASGAARVVGLASASRKSRMFGN